MGSAAAGAAMFSMVPGRVLGTKDSPSANNKLNIACVGAGGVAKYNLAAVEQTENIVALCDVDWDRSKEIFTKYPGAKPFKDYRQMLDVMGNEIDGVIVATPDHTHACIAMECMKRGKHVYVQKPLSKSVYEARKLTEAARKYKVMTQMGNQGHSGEGIRLVCEWIWDGAIGDVREVHAWTNRPIWPQALKRPDDTPAVPDALDWDLWLGPAPYRPYHRTYHPWNWRAWVDFGTGALGDMACHILDPVFWALKLRYASSVQGSYAKICTGRYKIAEHPESYPTASVIHLEYPARGSMPPVTVHWYDGGLMPPRPDELEPGRKMGDEEGGVLFVGDKGKLLCGAYGRGAQLIPYSRMREYKRPEKTLPRVNTSHEMDWVRSCKDGKPAGSNFDVAGPFTEMVLMGNLALHRPNEKLLWDGEAMRVTNSDDMDRFVNPPYREGWSL